MNEDLFFFLFFLAVVAVLFLLPLVLSIVAMARSRKARGLEERVRRVEIQTKWLRGRLAEVEKGAPGEREPPLLEPEEPAPPPAAPEAPTAAEPPPGERPPVRPAPRAPAAAPTVSRRPPKPRAPRAKIDWEQWIGVRGAALLGGIVLALAALLFFKYSIDHGWISPAVRVVMGVLAGLVGLVGSEFLRKKGYIVTANAVSGASVVILYAAFWAARVQYELIGSPLAFGLMILVTAVACLLAVRHASLVIAVLGLVGGFATPLLLSTGEDRPVGLFGYILLLDVGLLAVARTRRWPSLGVLSLIGTVLMQFLWIGFRMDAERVLLGLGILAVFALLFAFTARAMPEETRRRWLGTQAAAVLLPFAFSIYFASRVDFGTHFAPVAVLLLILSAAAGWIGRKQGAPWLPLGAAVGAVAVTGIYILQQRLDTGLAWETVGLCVLLAAVFHLFVEWDREKEGVEGPGPAAVIAGCGLMLALIVAALLPPSIAPWPWLAGLLALAALLYRHAAFPGRAVLQMAAALGVALGLSVYQLAHYRGSGFPEPALYIGLLVAVGILFQAAALLRRDQPVRAAADHAAAVYAVFVLAVFLNAPLLWGGPPAFLLAGALLLGLLAALAASRLSSGVWLLVAMAVTALVHVSWTWNNRQADHPDTALAALGLQALAVVLFTAWPFLFPRLREIRWAWYAAALAGPAWFLPMRELFETRFGDGFIGALPVLLGVVSVAGLLGLRRVLPAGGGMHKTALVWLSAVALGFIAVAIPLQLEKEWVTIGWALEGLAVILLWKRLDHAGLKWFGLALLAAVAVRLVANPAVLGYHARSGWIVLSWLHYTYLVPAACLLGAAAVLMPREAERARPWEGAIYARGHAVGAALAGLGAILVVFVWINLAIAEWFSAGDRIVISFERMPARDMTTSIAWAVYALILLGIGMARRNTALRWVSLGFLLVTIGKVFLHDLGELEDLYRVASLLGLAISLIAVSLLYQRFVFGKGRAGPPEE